MRFRRCRQSILPSLKPKAARLRGRPSKSAGEAADTKIRVSGKSLNKILSYQRAGESYNDTLVRILEMLDELTQDNQQLREQLKPKSLVN